MEYFVRMKVCLRKIWETSITIKGQVVIPAKIRQLLGLKKGTRVFVEERNGEIILRPLTREYFKR